MLTAPTHGPGGPRWEEWMELPALSLSLQDSAYREPRGGNLPLPVSGGGGRQEWEGLPLWVLEDLQLTVPGEAGFVPHVAALRGYVTQAPRGSSICSAPLPCLQVQPPD